jgi:short-subunit dehydrogenase
MIRREQDDKSSAPPDLAIRREQNNANEEHKPLIMNNASMSHPLAFITGASSGLGALFAKELALRDYSLILTSRRKERMEALAAEIQDQHPVPIEIIPADLSLEEDLTRLEQRVLELDNLELLINNAGFGTVGKFARLDPDRPRQMVDVHLMATVRLSRAALPGMVARRHGAIINVASMAAFFPLPGGAVYCATKAALVAFSQTLAFELRGSGVKVQALCPGFIYTGFHETPEYERTGRSRIPRIMWGRAEPVITDSLKALKTGKVIVLTGTLNKTLTFFGRNAIFSPFVKIVIRMFFSPK